MAAVRPAARMRTLTLTTDPDPNPDSHPTPDSNPTRTPTPGRAWPYPVTRWSRPRGCGPEGARACTGRVRRPRALRARRGLAAMARGSVDRAYLMDRPGHRSADRPGARPAARPALPARERHLGGGLRGERVRGRVRGRRWRQTRQHTADAVRPLLCTRRRGGSRVVGTYSCKSCRAAARDTATAPSSIPTPHPSGGLTVGRRLGHDGREALRARRGLCRALPQQ